MKNERVVRRTTRMMRKEADKLNCQGGKWIVAGNECLGP